jgi:hypothetical protein
LLGQQQVRNPEIGELRMQGGSCRVVVVSLDQGEAELSGLAEHRIEPAGQLTGRAPGQ